MLPALDTLLCFIRMRFYSALSTHVKPRLGAWTFNCIQNPRFPTAHVSEYLYQAHKTTASIRLSSR